MAVPLILEATQTTGDAFHASGQCQILVCTVGAATWPTGNVITLQIKSPHPGDDDKWIDTEVTWDSDGMDTFYAVESPIRYRLSATVAGCQASLYRFYGWEK